MNIKEEALTTEIDEFVANAENNDVTEDEINERIWRELESKTGELDPFRMYHKLMNLDTSTEEEDKFTLIEYTGNWIEINKPMTKSEIFEYFDRIATKIGREFGLNKSIQMKYYNKNWKPQPYEFEGKNDFSYPIPQIVDSTVLIPDFITLVDWTPFFHATPKFNFKLDTPCYMDAAFLVFGPNK